MKLDIYTAIMENRMDEYRKARRRQYENKKTYAELRFLAILIGAITFILALCI